MNQHKLILDYLAEKGGITNREAMLELGIGRLPSRIHELRRAGYEIISVPETAKNRYGEITHYIRYKKSTAVKEEK